MKEYTEPRMHTAEHILNQTMVRMFDRGRSFSSHIEKKKSKCDYHFDRNLTSEEVARRAVRTSPDLQARQAEVDAASAVVAQSAVGFAPRLVMTSNSGNGGALRKRSLG